MSKSVQEKSLMASPVGGYGYGGMSGTIGSRVIPSDGQLLLEYATNGIVYGCADINAKAFSRAVLRAYVPDKSPAVQNRLRRKSVAEYEEVDTHPLLNALKPEALYLLSTYFDVLGRAYLYVYDDFDGVGVDVLMPQCVTPLVDSQGNVVAYDYRVGQQMEPQRLDAADVIAFLRKDLRNHNRGQSSLSAVYSQVTISSKMADYMSAVLDNRGRPEIILSPKDVNAVVTPESAEKLLAQYNNRYRNRGNGGAGFVDAAIDVNEIGYSPTDLAPIQIDEHTQSIVAFAFGIPEPLIHGNAATYSNYETAKAIHAENVTTPRCCLFAEKFTAFAAAKWEDESVVFEFDSVVPADKAERRAAVETAAKLRIVEDGVLTENEAREMLALPPVDGGDERYVGVAAAPAMPGMPGAGGQQPPNAPDPNVPADAEDEPTDEADGEEAAEADAPAKAFDVDALLRINEAVAAGTLPRAAGISFAAKAYGVEESEAPHWIGDPKPKATTPTGTKGCGCGCSSGGSTSPSTASSSPPEQKRKALPPLDKHGQKIKGAVGGYFASLKAEALGKIDKGVSPEDLTSDLSALFTKADDTGNLPSAFVELDRWANKLRGKADDLAHKVKPLIEMSVTETADGKRKALVRAGASPDAFEVMPQKITEATDQRAYAFADSTMATTRSTLQTAIDGVKDRIKQGLEDGDPIDVMRRAISEVFENAETYEAERIARTEASAAVHSGQLIAAKESGIVKGMKPLVSDDACEYCKSHDEAGEIALGDIDDSGAVDAEGVPPYHPNCTCTWMEVIDLGD